MLRQPAVHQEKRFVDAQAAMHATNHSPVPVSFALRGPEVEEVCDTPEKVAELAAQFKNQLPAAALVHHYINCPPKNTGALVVERLALAHAGSWRTRWPCDENVAIREL